MDGRMRRYGGSASPDRSRAWSEPPPSPPPPQQAKVRKIPVVYYLCRNRHLEHPHFIEVPLSSHDGLYLRDVINRLNVLRGKGMPAMYSWSCKRSYKNGFVWHDLSEDDLILPAHGNEYVLKGSELLDQSPPDRTNHGATNPKPQTPKPPQQETPNSSRTHQASSSSSPNIAIKEAKNPPSPSHYPNPSRPGSSSDISPETGRPRLWESSSPGPEENNNVYHQPNRAANASTQTDDRGGRTARGPKHSCTRGVSTEDFGSPDPEFNHTRPTRASRSVSGGDGILPPPTSSSVSSSGGGKTETLESLIRAEASKKNSFRILEEEEVFVPSMTSKVKATNVLMQLITCGSISVKDHHSFGLIPNYRPRFSQVNFPSPMFGSSMWMRDLDCLSENPRMLGLRLEDKEYFSGSLIETKKYKEESGRGAPTLKRSSSYNADRSCSPDSKRERENMADSSRSKCLPRTIKITSNKQPTAARSPISEYPRNSSGCLDDGQSSKGGSKRFTDTAVRGSSTRFEPYKEEKEKKVFKIEERLTSGARVIIQSRAPCDDSEGSSSS